MKRKNCITRVLKSFRRYLRNRKAKKTERYYRKKFGLFRKEVLEIRDKWDEFSDCAMKGYLKSCESMWRTLGGRKTKEGYYLAFYGGVFVKGDEVRLNDEMFLWRLREENARRAIRAFPTEKLVEHLQNDNLWIAQASLEPQLSNPDRQPHMLVRPDTYKKLLKEELDKRQKAV